MTALATGIDWLLCVL